VNKITVFVLRAKFNLCSADCDVSQMLFKPLSRGCQAVYTTYMKKISNLCPYKL